MTQVEPGKRPKTEHLLDRKMFLPIKNNIKLEFYHKYRYIYFETDRIRENTIVKDIEDHEKLYFYCFRSICLN